MLLIQKLLASLAYAATAGTATWTLITSVQSAGGARVTLEEWITFAVVLIPAFWGKFSSNTTWVAPSRKGESVSEFGPDATFRR